MPVMIDGVSSGYKLFSRSVWHRLLRLFRSIETTTKNGQCSVTDQNDQLSQLTQRISEHYDGCDPIKLRPYSDHLPNAFFCGLTDRIELIVVSEHTHSFTCPFCRHLKQTSLGTMRYMGLSNFYVPPPGECLSNRVLC
jgi:hypothetical protein